MGNPRAHHTTKVFSPSELLAAFGTSDVKAVGREIQKLGQRELQAKFRVVYGTPTFSNNNCWLRRKLAEAAGIHSTPKAPSGNKGRYGAAKRAKDASMHLASGAFMTSSVRMKQRTSHSLATRLVGGVRRTMRMPRLKASPYDSRPAPAPEDEGTVCLAATSQSTKEEAMIGEPSTPTGPVQGPFLWDPTSEQRSRGKVLLGSCTPTQSYDGSASAMAPETPEQLSRHTSRLAFAGESRHKMAQMASKLLDEDFIFGSDAEEEDEEERQQEEERKGVLQDMSGATNFNRAANSLASSATDYGAASEMPDWALLPVPEPLPSCFEPELPELQDDIFAAFQTVVSPFGLPTARSTPCGDTCGDSHAWQSAVRASQRPSMSLSPPCTLLGAKTPSAPKELSGPAYRVYRSIHSSRSRAAPEDNTPLRVYRKLNSSIIEAVEEAASPKASKAEAELLSLFERPSSVPEPIVPESHFARSMNMMQSIHRSQGFPAKPFSASFSCPLPSFGNNAAADAGGLACEGTAPLPRQTLHQALPKAMPGLGNARNSLGDGRASHGPLPTLYEEAGPTSRLAQSTSWNVTAQP